MQSITIFESDYGTTRLSGFFDDIGTKPDYRKERAQYWEWKKKQSRLDDFEDALIALSENAWKLGLSIAEVKIGAL